MEELTGNPIEPTFIDGLAKIFRKVLEQNIMCIQIEKLDPNLLTEKEIDKISEIYGKNPTDITDKDIKYVDKIYEKYKKENAE